MGNMKLSLSCLLILTTTMLVITSANASRPGEKIHFQDSSELGELDIDERTNPRRGNRNHRGRALGHQKRRNEPEFEQGLPGVYPIKGPPQAPLVLTPKSTTQSLNNVATSSTPAVNYEAPVYATTTQLNNTAEQQSVNHPYAHNPFLSKIKVSSTVPTINTNYSKVLNSEKLDSTTASYVNPRRIDLLYGSNLLEEESNRENQNEATTEISFGDRGLFDTAPHCKEGEILIRTKCRKAV